VAAGAGGCVLLRTEKLHAIGVYPIGLFANVACRLHGAHDRELRRPGRRAIFRAGQLALIALIAMMGSYLPTIRYYRLPLYWVLTLPAAAVLFLAMTWTSAIRYLRGERSRWKNRSYMRLTGAKSTGEK